jgi:hypothetical protein
MKKMIFLTIVLLPALLFAQGSSDNQNSQNPYVSKSGSSLFNPSKLKIHQSYSFGYYSGGGTSGSVGYYLNSIEYAFSDPLKIRVDLGFLHSPTSILSGHSNSGVFVPGFSLDWRPSRYFNFRLDYQHVPAYNNAGPFYFNPSYYGEGYH